MHTLLRLAALGLMFLVGLLALTISPALAAEGVPSNATIALLGDTASWALLAGFLTPLLTSVVQQPTWTSRTRTLVAVVASVIVGVVTLLANGTFSEGPQTVLSILALVVVTSATAYKTLYVPSGLAPALENATSKTPPAAPDPSGTAPADSGQYPESGY
jgi:peptidoglycan/LPS O-acetylase OafA/YrhL